VVFSLHAYLPSRKQTLVTVNNGSMLLKNSIRRFDQKIKGL
jgi:hypothetical protein